MSHLGERVTALVDGQLPGDVAERAYAHVAGCPSCRAELEAEREVKRRLAAAPEPAPSPDLTGRLVRLGGPHGPLPPRTPQLDPQGAPAPWRSAPAADGRRPPGRTRAVGRRPDRGRGAPRRVARWRAAGAGLGLVGVVAIGGVLAPGSEPALGPAVVPPVSQFTADHGVSTRQLPLHDPDSGVLSPEVFTVTFGTGGPVAGGDGR